MTDLLAPHDPGGAIRTLLAQDTTGTAVFGGERQEYRYRLGRTWGEGPRALFIMMNPSTADPLVNDPTVAKCCRFGRRWGMGGIDVGNTFAYRATDQSRLLEISDPVGPENDAHLIAMAETASLVIFAYGKPKKRQLQARGLEVVRLLQTINIQPHVLRLSKAGIPWHPLYLPEKTIVPELWNI